jgi:large subunit ribosomal protein L22
MRGPKTNEGATRVDERVGTRAQVRYVRVSATKAREVLDLIRGRHVGDADEILRFTERDIAIVIRKALASAVANAQHNDSQDPDELYVAACFADDGPTLKRFRPRARGRATRIRKRTCHITIIVARMSDDQLEQRRRKEEGRPQAGRRGRVGGRAATSRRERVARSRQAAAAARGEVAHDHDHDHEDTVEELEAVEDADEVIDAEIADQDVESDSDDTEADEVETGTEADTDEVDTETDVDSEFDDISEEHPYGAGSAAPLEDGSAPEGYDIKGNADSMLYHVPESPYYGRTKAEVYFATVEDAEAAGFNVPGSQDDDEEGS